MFDLLEVARETGLRSHLHGVNAQDARQILERFMAAARAASEERRAPVQGYTPGIPWHMHLEAYDAYRKRWGAQQALIEGGCRGGFGVKELDDFIPGWRERLSVFEAVKRENAELREALANARAAIQVPAVVADVLEEVQRAIAKFPTWPTDPIHACKVVDEEAGELSKAVLQQMYEPHKNQPDDVRKEAIQAAAMCLRFLASLDQYDWTPSAQHQQPTLSTGASAA